MKIICLLLCLIAGLASPVAAQTTTTVAYKYAFFTQNVPVNAYAGKPFKLTGAIKVASQSDKAVATLFAQIKLRSGKTGYRSDPAKTFSANSDWKVITLNGKIDSDAISMQMGGFIKDNGTFCFDEVVLQVEQAPGSWTTVAVNNGGFEQSSLTGWTSGTPEAPLIFDGLKLTIANNNAFRGRNALQLDAHYIDYGNNAVAGRYAEVNGIKLYYESYGEGQPLILLHGNGGSIANHSARISFFKSKYRVIAVDSRLQGRSGDDGKELTYDLMANDLDKLLEQLHIDSAYIWGQSDGGIIALEMALKYPKRVRKLATWGANIRADSSAFAPSIYKSIEQVANTASDSVKKRLNTLMLRYPQIPFADLGSIKIPALIMAGDKDAIAPEHSLKIYQHLPKGQLFIMPGATHYGAYEKPNLFNEVLLNFFR
jgi:pimeloyl-ACP methyl ester carboxylesterase